MKKLVLGLIAALTASMMDWLRARDMRVVLLDVEPGPMLAAAPIGLKPVLLSTVGTGGTDVLKVMAGNIEALKIAFRT